MPNTKTRSFKPARRCRICTTTNSLALFIEGNAEQLTKLGGFDCNRCGLKCRIHTATPADN